MYVGVAKRITTQAFPTIFLVILTRVTKPQNVKFPQGCLHMAKRPKKAEAKLSSLAESNVVVGWTHHNLSSSIGLRIQSVTSKQALDNDEVESHHFLMTHNQALLLAKYLLDATEQSLPVRQKRRLWRRILGAFRK